MKTLSILTTKITASLLKLIGRGGSMPGSIGLKLDPNILSKLHFNGPVVLITGTNGKTSTANMIADLFQVPRTFLIQEQLIGIAPNHAASGSAAQPGV